MSPLFNRRDRAPAPAPIADGGELRRARARTGLLRGGILASIAAGPLALALAVIGVQTTSAAPAAAPAVPLAIAPPTGYAEQFVDLWLRSSGDSTASTALRAMAPGVDLPRPKSTARLTVQKTIAVRSQPIGGRTWQVTVAATVVVPPADAQSGQPTPNPAQNVAQGSAQGRGTQPGTTEVRYFAVPVAMTRTAGSGGAPDALVISAAPAQVAAPSSLSGPDPAVPDYGAQVGDGLLRETVTGYLSAYLTGVGDSSRYLAPGAAIPAPGSTYTQVTLKALATTTSVLASPADGSVLVVQAVVQATDASGDWPLVYPLRLVARAGRWEVSALAPVAVATVPGSASPSGVASPPSPSPSSSNGARP
ncbi:hypothetical protein ABT093_19910 [Kitasatospora sp. NPDC002551]|uniref:hypothetical protein n=1 Tax=Kitasatospora sp. NPDC002551 TaxID=3154539 RepID=UPI00331E531F